MAYVWTEQRLVDNNKRSLIKYTLQGDNTSTANILLLDASSLAYALNTSGYIMTSNTDIRSSYKTTIKRVWGQMSTTAGYSMLQWHKNGANTPIVTFGAGTIDYDLTQLSGDVASIPNTDLTATGDILYSASSHSGAHSLTLFVELKKDGRDYDQGQTADPIAFNKTGIL